MKGRTMNPWAAFCGQHELVTDSTPITIEIGPTMDPAIDLRELPWDALAQQHGYALSQEKISAERFYSILELRSMSQIASQLAILPLTSLNEPVINHFLDLNHLDGGVEQRFQTWANNIDGANDNFISKLKIKSRHWDPRIYNLLELCHRHKIIFIEQYDDLMSDRFLCLAKNEVLTIYLPSMTARTHLGNMAFAKTGFVGLQGRVGKLTIDDIEESIRLHSRYASFSYPGVADSTSFHDVIAPMFFLTLHDELHRHGMSAIPPAMLDHYLYAIDVVRAGTGIRWSKDIWNAIDLEIDIRHLTLDNPPASNPVRHNTEVFQAMLSRDRFSDQGVRGLFVGTSVGNAMLDTALIILIHIMENKGVWDERGISLHFFADYPAQLIYQVQYYLGQLDAGLPMATKVAVIKDAIINKVSGDLTPLLNQYQHQATFEKRDGYIQVVSNNEVVAHNEKSKFILQDMIRSLRFGIAYKSDHKQMSDNFKCFIEEVDALSQAVGCMIESKKDIQLNELEQIRRLLDVALHLSADPCNKEARQWLRNLVQGETIFKKELMAIKSSFIYFEHYPRLYEEKQKKMGDTVYEYSPMLFNDSGKKQTEGTVPETMPDKLSTGL